jgi:RHS repeat-associated protein
MQRMKSGSEDWLYFYTADDERIWSYNVPENRSRWTLRDLGNQVLREYASNNGSWGIASDYIYRDGLLLAAETPAGPKHFHLDHLGTPRLITNSTGQQTAYHVYYPFGEEATAFNQDTERMKFTGHERDLASPAGSGDDLEYMHARACSPVTGRFVSVDPSDSARRSQPQTWNKYTYGLNNPVRYIDKDGQVEREGQLAGVIVNRSSATIWIAGDVGNKTYVIPLEPGESSDSYFKDADAVVIDPGELTPKGAVVEPSVEGKQSGAFKIGVSEVEVSDAGPLNLDISRGIGYVGSWALGRAGYLDSEEAQANGWVIPKDKEKAATDKEKLREKREEDKRQEGRRQKKRNNNSGHKPPST